MDLNRVHEVAERYRGKDVALAIDASAAVIAVGADADEVLATAQASGKPYVFLYAPPADDVPSIFLG